MKKMTRIFGTLFAAAAALFTVTACQSTKNQPVDPAKDFIQLDKKEVNAILSAQTASGEAFAKLQPGKIYVAKNLADRFSLTHKAAKEPNQEGAMCARVYAQMDELPFFQWLVYPGRPDQLAFRFIWFDKAGKVIPNTSVTTYRESMPGDPVRFTAKIPDGGNDQFCFVVGYGAKPEAPKAKKDVKKEDAAKKDAKKADAAKK